MAEARSEEAASGVVGSVRFSFYTAEEIRRLSVKRITKSDLLDEKQAPVPDGLYDPALGPLKDTDPCKSCGQLSVRCPGHFGHIDLAKQVYHPLLFSNLKQLLHAICFHCHRFKRKEEKVQKYVCQLELIMRGDVVASRNLKDLSLDDSFSLEEHSLKSAASFSSGSYTKSKDLKKQTLTSFQYTEAKQVLSDFMNYKAKKCENCNKKNPRITSPVFGWLNKVTKISDIRSNTLGETKLGASLGDGDSPDTGIISEAGNPEVLQSDYENASETDEVSTVTKALKQTKKPPRGLPREFINQMNSSGQKHLLPSEVEHILESVWKNEPQLCTMICDIQCRSLNTSVRPKGYAMFFLKALLVPPIKFRPPAKIDRGVLEHPQNVLLSNLQDSDILLRNLIETDSVSPGIVRRWMDLQKNVNILFDSSKGLGKTEKETSGLRQLLEKKTGILRQKMMGKRVNFACRSVISPDPYLAVNEIGIPPYFALRLTYPERVTPWNVHMLKHAMENGADRHPGATHYKDRERMYKLQSGQMRNANSRKLHTSRGVMPQTGKDPESEFEGKVVYRHVRDGDIVLVNRQPTLHKPSLMAHVVRVLKGEKTLRMHYANCSTYNADFDGDEMNVHLPQDEVSRAEAVNIVNANMQYTVPTSGDPIRGLIQDHIISSVLLTKKDTFLNQDEYHQLLYASCVPSTDLPYQSDKSDRKIYTLYSDNEIQPLFPAILKPKPLWTGKQVISAVLCYITRGHQPFSVEHKGKIPSEYFTKDCSEQKMYVYNNELVHGMIDKNQFGKYGLVHTVHELYGPDKAGTLLSVFSRLFTSYLQMHGSTCGVDDLLLAHDSELERKRILERSEVLSEDVHLRFTASEKGDIDPMELHTEVEKVIRSNGDIATTRLDRMMSNALNGLTSEVNMILFPNGLQKSFPRNCLSLMTASGAKGGPVNMSQISSLLGQQELEGKRVPRMMSGKTLPSFPPWDISSRAGGFISDRFLTGLRPQEYYFHCMAGRDGLVDTAIKTSRSGYLQRCLIKNLEALKVNYDHTVRDADGSVIQFTYGEDGVDVLKSSFITEFEVLAANHKVILERLSSQLEDARLSKSNGYIEKLPLILRDKETSFIREKEKDGVTTNLLKKQRSSVHQIKKKDVKKLMEFKYLSSLAEPGEPVGVIAAQSIGEPSTQMTLNTFHFAGRGERNVTLGIPRLQEILMNAKQNIQTPVMTCPLLDGRTREDAEHIAAKFRRISVADIVESMEVCTVPFFKDKDRVSTLYKLKMKLYPLDLYPPHSEVTLETRTDTLEKVFVAAMEDAIAKHMETLSKINDIGDVSHMQESSLSEGGDEDAPKTKADDDGGGGGGGGNDDDDESIEDQGADAEKRKRQINDEMEYEGEVERKRFDGTEEFDGAPPSEIESDVDQGEVEDFTMGEESLDNEDEVDAPETESKAKPTPVSEPSKKKSKSETKKKASMPKRNKRKVERVNYCKSKGSNFEVHFIFRKEPHILLAEIAQKTAKRVYVKEYKNIEQCSVVERKRDKKSIELQTSGVNFDAFWNLDDFLNVNELETNDVHAMLETYGVEAARATIIKEVKNVFELYGIQVDIRHLSLIADFMTTHGGYRPMNRIGMGNFSTSPFTKMTFETATKFIFEAATRGEVDNLESPSASVCLGQPMKMGTGCFELMQNLAI